MPIDNISHIGLKLVSHCETPGGREGGREGGKGMEGKGRKGKEMKGKERKGKERKGKERKGKERKGKERKEGRKEGRKECVCSCVCNRKTKHATVGLLGLLGSIFVAASRSSKTRVSAASSLLSPAAVNKRILYSNRSA